MSAVLREGAHLIALECPACGLLCSAQVTIGSRLTVDQDGATMRVVLKQKGAPHTCNQPELRLADDDAGDGEPYAQPELDWAQRAAGERIED